MWQTPSQTLELERGDCEDMAILLTSMIRFYNNEQYWVECVRITDHIALYLPVEGGKICILDPAGKCTTNYGWSPYRLAKDIRTETNAWLEKWDSWNPENAPHEVTRVFSSYIWREFSNTRESIDWLYSRTYVTFNRTLRGMITKSHPERYLCNRLVVVILLANLIHVITASFFWTSGEGLRLEP